MLDPKFIREHPDMVKKALRDRNTKLNIDDFLVLDKKRREIISRAEDMKRQKNEASKKIGAMIRKKEDVTSVKAEVAGISKEIEVIDVKSRKINDEYQEFLDSIPNIPHESVPVGSGEADNKLIREEGARPKFSFKPKDHVELGGGGRLFDLERSAKITGSGFPLYVGAGAKLSRALINFMLDVHTKEHGYKEMLPPLLVNGGSMRGTGQLPKMADDMYKTEGEGLYLIPTAEVPLTNIHANECLAENDLPVLYAAYTACFRREAGSYGKDTRGITRVHQFDKVEMVKFTKPEDSMAEFETLLADAEDIIKRLGLAYRVMELCTADISFAAHKCYDIELWSPGTDRWLEVSSCSVFSDFQARRANIKYQPSDKNQKPRFVHTLNASGVALPRLVIALIETYQEKDGAIKIPDVLVPYFGAQRIES
ncbi:MAG: serine--tRNA ligase [Candidatus Omnitrophica bacterium]|nr:serine--tRNA ligase [Candidatus Omnitrophota bacterium]